MPSGFCANYTLHLDHHQFEPNFSSADVYSLTFKQLPQSLKSHILSFSSLRHFFLKKLERGGDSQIHYCEIPTFLLHRNHRKIP